MNINGLQNAGNAICFLLGLAKNLSATPVMAFK
jgi:hypothetical protein